MAIGIDFEIDTITIEDHGEEIICIRPLELSDVSDHYASWFGDPAITEFLEIKKKQTLAELRGYIASSKQDPSAVLLGIFVGDKQQHIGNINISMVNLYHQRAWTAILIGDRRYWGKGIAKKALTAIIEVIKKRKQIRKLIAGIYEANTTSKKLFSAIGFQEEARLENFLTYKNRPHTLLLYTYNIN